MYASERSPVVHTPGTNGHGDTRRWTRLIDGAWFAFTVVTMPDGEIRWVVTRYNGYVGGPQFGCAWSPHRQWTFRPQRKGA